MPRVTCVEEAVRAGKSSDTGGCRAWPPARAGAHCEHPPSAGRFQGWESAQHRVLFWHSEEHPAAEGCGGSAGESHQAALLHPGFGIISLSNVKEAQC